MRIADLTVVGTALLALVVLGCVRSEPVSYKKLLEQRLRDYRAHMREALELPPLDLPVGDSAPIVLGDDVIDARSGAVLRKAEWQISCYPPEPAPGRRDIFRALCFRQGEGEFLKTRFYRLLDSRSGKAIKDEYPEIRTMDVHDRTVVRQSASGQPIWSRELRGSPHSVRYPQWAASRDKIVVVHNEFEEKRYGLAGLNRETGEVVWISDGPNDRLFCSGDLVFATGCSTQMPNGRWVVARNLSDGQEAYRVSIPKEADPDEISEVAGMLCVTGSFRESFSVFFDSKGGVIHRLEEEVISGLAADGDAVLLTSKRLVRLTRDDKAVWESRLFADETGFAGAGALHLLPNGDLLVLAYPAISDGCERVSRISPKTGKVLWSAQCGGIGLYGHSNYSHRAYCDVRGQWVFVVGQASHGNTVTVLSLENGEEERRWIYHFE